MNFDKINCLEKNQVVKDPQDPSKSTIASWFVGMRGKGLDTTYHYFMVCADGRTFAMKGCAKVETAVEYVYSGDGTMSLGDSDDEIPITRLELMVLSNNKGVPDYVMAFLKLDQPDADKMYVDNGFMLPVKIVGLVSEDTGESSIITLYDVKFPLHEKGRHTGKTNVRLDLLGNPYIAGNGLYSFLKIE